MKAPETKPKARKPPYSGPEVLTIKQASTVLGCDRRTLYRAIDLGQIGAMRLGRTLRIPIAEIERLKALRQAG